MGTSVGTIEARPVARSVLLRTLMVLAAIVIGWAALATAWSLAADRPTGQPAVTPAGRCDEPGRAEASRVRAHLRGDRAPEPGAPPQALSSAVHRGPGPVRSRASPV